MSAIHNERVKLAAQALNNMSVAITTTGVVTQVVAALYRTAPLNSTLFPVAPALLFIGFAVHISAQLTLGRLGNV